ncbi:MAG: hypothetical protein KDI15_10740, partial [Thiothrix sp.]|nr:hypothetical protein [Thiothrix sp.]
MGTFTLFHRLRAIITLSVLWLLVTTPACAFVFMDGRNIDIESLTNQGRWTVMEVWSADCSVCHRTIGELQEFARRVPAA